jgi:hypothetical protein
MKRATIVSVAILAVLAFAGSTAFAQTAAARTAVVKVDFPFLVKGQEMPAGSYTFQIDNNEILVRAQGGPGQGAIMPVLTRLGRHDKDADPELVFDRVGGKYLLSEVWLPGEDGYLLLSTKEQHDHRVLGGSNPRK